MEVNRTSFPHHLLGMIVNISEADFVSFDLEFSGIPSRMPGRPQKRDRATLDDRYRETKAGAEKYQILQFGFTCATFDHIKNKYVLRPYNVNINPMLEEGFHFERDVSFQSGAVAFLREHGFDMNMPFTKGVSYLSRDEAARARQMAYDRIDRTNVIADIQLKDTDVDSLDFVRRAREAITNWKAGNFMGLEITSHTGLKNQPALTSISNFEKRLVHQLVRAEFPDVVAMGRADHIKIIDYDAVRESEHARRQKNRVKDQIVGQTGFRWVIEAMGNGDLDSIDPMSFAKNVDGISTAADLDHIKSKFHRALMRLKDRQGVLVGHNMFTDLVYLYHTFIGPLPDTLKEFCALTHELFPRIVDTKYLATYAGGDLNRSPPLEEIAEEYATQPLPDIGELQSLSS
jgi:poly(A)-specific ribonuclease